MLRDEDRNASPEDRFHVLIESSQFDGFTRPPTSVGGRDTLPPTSVGGRDTFQLAALVALRLRCSRLLGYRLTLWRYPKRRRPGTCDDLGAAAVTQPDIQGR